MDEMKETVTIPLDIYRYYVRVDTLLHTILNANGNAYDREKVIASAERVLEAMVTAGEGCDA